MGIQGGKDEIFRRKKEEPSHPPLEGERFGGTRSSPTPKGHLLFWF